jgi:uncharacterized protein YaiL (DUF2058 family)
LQGIPSEIPRSHLGYNMDSQTDQVVQLVEYHWVFECRDSHTEWTIRIDEENLEQDVVLGEYQKEYNDKCVSEVAKVEQIIVPAFLSVRPEPIQYEYCDNQGVKRVVKIVWVPPEDECSRYQQADSHYEAEFID